ncbi:MAG: HypC/HybG/HupF family hydrogenase formation chaperone [candidate division WOR-3 bacterium]
MCLAIPLRVKSIKGDMAVGEVDGIEREVSLMMTPDAKVGDYVIVHAGFAIQILDQKEAEENLDILRQMAGLVQKKKAEAKARRRT